ncbi:hemerythrin domain-containing protein [Georgenia wangjunii]|uniref:hemerythrin domain-containing protein n=1 Tax=Georgenia wangjunii TaxID=3117730 RepID=UPI002F26512B
MSGRGARGTRTDEVGCDTADMVVIHRLFRMLFTDAPGLVRGVPDGDTERAAVVAEHVAEAAGALHNHHHTEDELLWDELESRAPACALHVGQMRAQHAAVARVLDQLGDALPLWRASADPSDGDRVAALLDEVLALLEEHLGQEEERILPVAATAMSQREWDALGEHGRASVPRDRQMIQLGWILDSFSSPAEAREWARQNLPAPARAIFALLGRRQFEAHKRIVLGAAV